jgi:hypothetical protein
VKRFFLHDVSFPCLSPAAQRPCGL